VYGFLENGIQASWRGAQGNSQTHGARPKIIQTPMARGRSAKSSDVAFRNSCKEIAGFVHGKERKGEGHSTDVRFGSR